VEISADRGTHLTGFPISKRHIMASSWQKFEELMRQEMRKIYSEAVVEHSMNPRNLGDLEDANGFARVTGPCGDTMSIWLKVNGDTIISASFMTDGCGTTIASGSMVTEMIKGKSISEAQKTTQHDVLAALGGLPQESEHCALLAANTLKAALRDYIAMKQEPWKRAYRKVERE
jgi:nitrogen fixation NifU-like protein